MDPKRESQIRFLEGLASLPDVAINADDVYDDLEALAKAFPDPERYATALRAILAQLRILVKQAPGKPMQGRYAGWRRHAFQSQQRRGARADLRIVYRIEGGRAEVLGFGHRHDPVDVYLRLRERRERRLLLTPRRSRLLRKTKKLPG